MRKQATTAVRSPNTTENKLTVFSIGLPLPPQDRADVSRSSEARAPKEGTAYAKTSHEGSVISQPDIKLTFLV